MPLSVQMMCVTAKPIMASCAGGKVCKSVRSFDIIGEDRVMLLFRKFTAIINSSEDIRDVRSS